jgi:hypothetical protein
MSVLQRKLQGRAPAHTERQQHPAPDHELLHSAPPPVGMPSGEHTRKPPLVVLAGRPAPGNRRRGTSRSRRPVIYLDTSVALAQLFAEDRRPPTSFWGEPLVSSRLLEYEVWTRIHPRNLSASHGELARLLLGRLAFLELTRPVLARALEPFAAPVGTLDSLHVASMDFLRTQGQAVALASYDTKFVAAARRMRIPIVDL